MGKTNEALIVAEKQYDEHLQTAPLQPLHKLTKTPSSRWAWRSSTKKMYGDLKANLLNRSLNGSVKNILFIGTSNRESSYSHAIGFSAALTKEYNLKVLLVDLSLWTLSPHEVFKVNDVLGMSDLFGKGGKMASKIMKVGPENLFVVRWGGNHGGPIKLFESRSFEHFLKAMGKSFDYIVLNAPQVDRFSEFRTLCAKVDGVVLVLKAGRTGQQVALKARKERFENAENKLLGVVIDKEDGRHPRFLLILSLALGASLFFFAGFFFEHLQAKVGEVRSVITYNEPKADTLGRSISKRQFHAQIQPDHYDQKKALKPSGLSNLSLDNVDSQTSAMEGGSGSLQTMARLPAKSTKEAPMPSAETTLNGIDQARVGQAHVVVVKRGDTLFRIIKRTYGKFNERILRIVLRENPGINSTAHIYEGQIINLPSLVSTS